MQFNLDGWGGITERIAARDEKLRALGVSDIDHYRRWARQAEVENECDTDEYRECQPGKGFGMIADFLMDQGPGHDNCVEMMALVEKWIHAGANLTDAYAGADELHPILEHCFDWQWALGGFSLYTLHLEGPDVEEYIDAYQLPVNP